VNGPPEKSGDFLDAVVKRLQHLQDDSQVPTHYAVNFEPPVRDSRNGERYK